jgi:hypothetical protein
MIEKVRSIAIVSGPFGKLQKRTRNRCAGSAAYSRRAAMQQGWRDRNTAAAGVARFRAEAEFASNSKPERRFRHARSRPGREPSRQAARLTAMGCDHTPGQTGETTMIRKFILATAAVAALGLASVSASTPAAAWGGFHHHHHGFHGGFWRGGYGFYRVGYDSCWRNVWRVNRFGETVLRRVYVCAY